MMTFIRNLLFLLLFIGQMNIACADDKSLAILLEQGQENLALGYFRQASHQLQQAQQQAAEQENFYALTLAQGLQGYIALQHQDYAQAEKVLTAAFEQAQQNNWPDLQARVALYLGQLQKRQQRIPQARHFFEQALTYAAPLTDKSMNISALYQLADTEIDSQDFPQALQHLQQAQTELEPLSVNAMNSSLWLNIGYQRLRLYQHSPQTQPLNAVFFTLRKALTDAEKFKQFRVQASALKYLAELYPPARAGEAIKLVLAGIEAAQKVEGSDLLIDLEWQLGKLYQAQPNNLQAIAAYRRAVKHIEAIRVDIPVSYEQGRSSFRDTFAPLYLALANLLLQQTHFVSPPEQQALLKEAQDTIELMKKSELEDFFQSRCDISATPINLQKTNSHAAAIYPIPLPDRLEIIVYTADGLHHFTSPVSAKTFDEQARLFSKNLRDYADFAESRKQARHLYDWLIAPLKPLLEKQQIQTLIYIPDGGLRLVPLGALYDGKKFLIEDYAVVTSPGMSLIDDSATSQHKQQRILLAGMSVPGDVINDLPEFLLDNLVEDLPEKIPEKRQLTRDLKRALGHEKKRELTATEQAQKTQALRKMLDQPVMMAKLQKLLALPGVDKEITQLASQNDMPYLLNESFSLANFKQTLTAESHKILHIASHGFFGSTAEESFIMTYDRILNLNQLESLLNADYFKLYPIDLITLSACQTAEGDDRSPLGISGVAIKSKVHSALGSLWPVSDDATSELMTAFYENLKKPDYNKAKALQQAEIKLLKQQEFKNPSLWSPFVLVGNWQ